MSAARAGKEKAMKTGIRWLAAGLALLMLEGTALTGCNKKDPGDSENVEETVLQGENSGEEQEPASTASDPEAVTPAENPAGTPQNDGTGTPADPDNAPAPGDAPPADTPGGGADPEEQTNPAEADPGDGKHVISISLDKYAVVVQVGQSDMPWVTMYPETAENKGEIWTCNNTEIASVNSWGNITGVSEGTCQVTVRAADNPDVKAVVDVTVTAREEIPVDSISLDKNEVTVMVGLTDMPLVTMYPTTATDKGEVWESDDTSIATVNSYGLITGVGLGVCHVTVTSANNGEVSAQVTVKVVEKPVFREATYIDGILVVNKTYGLPKDYNPGVSPAAQAALDIMIEAAKEDGIELWVESGFRSYDLQNTIYNSYVSRSGQDAADRYSARPGYSEHQTGLAFDMNSFDQSFGETPEGRWLAEHAWEYGFNMRYPKDKEEITGFMYEPWHVRYFGDELAKILHESGQTLEEYLGISSAYPQ